MTQYQFGDGSHTVVVKKSEIDSIAESVVRDVWGKLPSDARTPEVIGYVIERAKELSSGMLVTYVSHTNLEERTI